MTIAARTIIENCQEALHDKAGVRSPASALVRHLNKAQRWMQKARPDTTAMSMEWPLVAGFRQELPAYAASLIDITANVTGKRSRITKADLPLMDAALPNWRSLSGKTEVVHFMYDLRVPRQVLVYPPAAAGAVVDLEYSRYPQDVPAPTGDGKAFSTVIGDISVADKWQTALEALILHYAYAKDLEGAGNTAISVGYLQQAAQELGLELQAATTVEPKV